MGNFSFFPKLIECTQDYENLYFVMEYLPYGNLRQLIKSKKIFSL